jgi:bacteriocin biosynthesis cyclodehydratase domain-containing protein
VLQLLLVLRDADRRLIGTPVSPVPLRPLLTPWYRLVPDGERLLFEHAGTLVSLEGGAVRTLLPSLLPLLDGSRTVDDLIARLGDEARPAVEAALGALATHGLVVEGVEPELDDIESAEAPAAAYGLQPGVAATRLRDSRVGVLGRSVVGVEAARLLRSAGITAVPAESAERVDTDVDLALVTPTADQVSLLPDWNRVALARRTRWIGVRPFDGAGWMLGPLVVPGESCCYECLLLRLASHLEYAAELPLLEKIPSATSAGPALELVAIGILVHLTLCWLVGRDRSLPGVLHVVEAPRLALTTHTVLRVPRCPACSPSRQLPSRLPWHEASPIEAQAA